ASPPSSPLSFPSRALPILRFRHRDPGGRGPPSPARAPGGVGRGRRHHLPVGDPGAALPPPHDRRGAGALPQGLGEGSPVRQEGADLTRCRGGAAEGQALRDGGVPPPPANHPYPTDPADPKASTGAGLGPALRPRSGLDGPGEGGRRVAVAANLGFPRIGAHRELKRQTERYWKGELTEADLLKAGQELRLRHWQLQQEVGIDIIPSNDFSFYDHVLDMACVVGAIPERFGWTGGPVSLETYFAMARGRP